MPTRTCGYRQARDGGSKGKLTALAHWIFTSDCYSCKLSRIDYEDMGYEFPTECKDCFPGVHEYNKATYVIYTDCSEQYIMGSNGAICINILAIDSVMDDNGITDGVDRLEIRRELNHLSGMVLKMQRDKAKKK